MRSLRPKWTVTPWTAWRWRLFGREHTAPRFLPSADEGPGGGYEVEGACIVDHEAGLTYEATIGVTEEGRRWLASVTVIAHGPDHAITNAIRIPAYTIAEQVALQLAADRELREQTGSPNAFNLAGGLRRGAQQAPDVEQIGRDHANGLDRWAIQEKYGVSVFTADKWLTKARRAGTVPAATRGRPAGKGQGK